MLKANSKEVKKAIDAYIMDLLEDEEGTNTAEQLQAVLNSFKNYYCKNDNIQDSFINFLRGLGVSSCEYATYKQGELIKKWMQETPQEAKAFTPEQIDKLFYCLVYKGFKRLFNQYNINLYDVIE